MLKGWCYKVIYLQIVVIFKESRLFLFCFMDPILAWDLRILLRAIISNITHRVY